MTTYNWSDRTNGEELAFDPATDILHFDDASITAGIGEPDAHFDFFLDPGPPLSSYFAFAGTEIALLDVDARDLTTEHITFASGSLFIYGDDSIGTLFDDEANTLNGGAGDDWLVGAGGADVVNGNEGDDMLVVVGRTTDGRYGNDTLNGGSGVDQVFFDGAEFAININLSTGVATGGDLAAGSSTLSLTGIEQATTGAGNDTLTGSGAANWLFGQEGRDRLVGKGGADTLMGGTGADTMIGGTGSDTYYVNAQADEIVEKSGEGIDLVYSTTSEELDSHVENLTLTGSANLTGTGNGLDNAITGNEGDNILSGGSGDDVLLGMGGADTLHGGSGHDTLNGGDGDDSMIGGDGDDTYHVIENGDVVVEELDDGIDTIITNRAITMDANVENLIWSSTDGGGVCTGNKLDNVMGNTGDVGGLIMNGRGGVDTVSYAAQTDAITINLLNGLATIVGSDTLQNIENAEGGLGDDSLIGDAGANVLNGSAGADTMQGGDGNDTYYVDSEFDVVEETGSGDAVELLLPGSGSTGAPGAGLLGIDGFIDTVVAAIDFSVASLEFVENITLSGDAVEATGNALANELQGNNLANLLSGAGGRDTLAGGAGNDTLDGGAGADVMRGDGGNDRLVWSGAEAGINGGAGTDTLKVAGDNLNLKNVDNSKILNIEQIDLRGGGANLLTVTEADVLAISFSTNVLKVLGDGADTVNAAGFTDLNVSVGAFDKYQKGSAVLLVDTDMNVVT